MTTDEGTFSIRANYDKLKQDAESEAVSSEDGTDKVRESYVNHHSHREVRAPGQPGQSSAKDMVMTALGTSRGQSYRP
jgi:hypothetical protein